MCGMLAIQPANPRQQLISKTFRKRAKHFVNFDFLLKNGSDCAAEKLENFFFQKVKSEKFGFKM